MQTAANVGNVILVLSGLSFIGVGAQPPHPRVGRDDHRRPAERPDRAVVDRGCSPAWRCWVTVVAVNLLADSIPRRPRARARPPRRGARPPSSRSSASSAAPLVVGSEPVPAASAKEA
ncbi:MAG: hypothetical protein PGN11_14345 [Quadrisphaera sp.]